MKSVACPDSWKKLGGLESPGTPDSPGPTLELSPAFILARFWHEWRRCIINRNCMCKWFHIRVNNLAGVWAGKGGFWVREKDRTRSKNVDVLRNSGVRCSRDHSQQRSRLLRGSLVSRHPYVWASYRQVKFSLLPVIVRDGLIYGKYRDISPMSIL